jgi:hypothetical protein
MTTLLAFALRMAVKRVCMPGQIKLTPPPPLVVWPFRQTVQDVVYGSL